MYLAGEKILRYMGKQVNKWVSKWICGWASR